MTTTEMKYQQTLWAAYACLRQAFRDKPIPELADATAYLYEILMNEAETAELAHKHTGELRRELAEDLAKAKQIG